MQATGTIDRSGRTIDPDRLFRRITELSRLTESDRPWTRRSFSSLFLQGRAWLAREFEAAGLSVSIDAGGNLIGRCPGRDLTLAPIVTGSHSDTVPGGGRFDGILGVLAGIEVAQALRENGHSLAHTFEVIDFLAEEPSEYGPSCIGSRAFAGQLEPTMLKAAAPDGENLEQGLTRVGGAPDQLATARRGGTAAFVELHIEQGPVLESRHLPIGVVTNIVGIRRVRIVVDGRPDHAGTTPMDIRRDALAGAAHIVAAANAMARDAMGGPNYVVATVGRLNVYPNAANAVPGRVEMTLEVRSDAEAVLHRFPEDLLSASKGMTAKLGVTVAMEQISYSQPTACAPFIQETIEDASGALGLRSMRLSSGAGHDGVYVAKTGPIGMIFIPCRDGRSHCAEEWAELAQVADGARVLYETILRLDRRLAR